MKIDQQIWPCFPFYGKQRKNLFMKNNSKMLKKRPWLTKIGHDKTAIRLMKALVNQYIAMNGDSGLWIMGLIKPTN